MIEVRCCHSVGELAPLRDELDALNRASSRPDPFSTLAFYENYLLHDQLPGHAAHCRPRFLTAFADGRLVGFLPLKQTRHRVFGLRATRLDFFAVHDNDRPHLIAASDRVRDVTAAFYQYLFDRGQDWGLLEFHQQQADSPLLRHALAGLPAGYRIFEWPSWSNWTIPIRWDSLPTYFHAFSKKFRSNVSRQMRSLFAAGTLEFIESSDPAVTPALLELYRGIEPYSWKAQAGLNIGRAPARIDYVNGLLDGQQPMRISILLLLLDGVPVAGLINGAYDRGLHALHIVFDDRLSRLSPGSAMLLMGMRQAISGGHRFFNLLSGFGYFKNRWLAEVTETRSVQIYRKRTPFYWRRVIGDRLRSLVRVATTRAPLLFNPVRRTVAVPPDAPASAGAPPFHTPPGDRRRIIALLAAARRGRCEFLSAAELAAAMPFETMRAPAQPEATVAPGANAPRSTATPTLQRGNASLLAVGDNGLALPQ